MDKTDPEEEIQNEQDEEEILHELDEEVLTFTYRSGYYDMTLIVEGRKIPIVKSILSVASPVFEAMFEGDFKEKQQAEIELPGKNYADFVDLLSCLYPDKLKCVTKDNVYRLLPLVHEYQLVDILHQQCDKLICEILRADHVGNPSEIYRHLQLSNTYNLEMVKEKCIDLASELTTEEMEEGSSEYTPEDKQTLKIHLLALKRHELDKADDMDLLNNGFQYTSIRGSQNINCKPVIGTRIDGASSCDEVLQALRLCYRYPDNAKKRDSVFSKLHELYKEFDWNQELFDLLPDLAKQAWEKYCLIKAMSET